MLILLVLKSAADNLLMKVKRAVMLSNDNLPIA